MKTSFNKATKPATPEYPCLMKSQFNNNIYLMTGYGVGTRINSGANGSYLGEWSDEWSMNTLEPYYGTVTLEN